MVWETVIGIETHVQLSTKTKLFSRASTEFGKSPNTNVNLIDCGLPGVLPSVNKEAFYKAIRFGLAVGAKINQTSIFDRKNYFYADLPKGYQITQMDLPIVLGGTLDIETEEGIKTVNITRAHLEEDAGKSIHDQFDGYSAIDLNRAGTPLLEIVSEPEISSAKEAVAYMKAMHQLVTYLDVSDGNMSQGSLRCDANVSVRKVGDTELGTRTEIKNINSFRFVEKAINFEVKRQIKQLENGETVTQETRLYDSIKDETRPMRSKEFANDYRYFPEPDLVPVTVTEEQVNEIRSAMGEPPSVLRKTLADRWKIPANDAGVLVNQGPELVRYFEDLATRVGEGKVASNWMQQDVLRTLNERGGNITDFPVRPEAVADIIARVQKGDFDTSRGREIFASVVEKGASVAEVVAGMGIAAVDDGDLRALCEELIAENPKIVADVKGGKEQAAGGLIGKAKRKNPNVNPAKVRALAIELIQALP